MCVCVCVCVWLVCAAWVSGLEACGEAVDITERDAGRCRRAHAAQLGPASQAPHLRDLYCVWVVRDILVGCPLKGVLLGVPAGGGAGGTAAGGSGYRWVQAHEAGRIGGRCRHHDAATQSRPHPPHTRW